MRKLVILTVIAVIIIKHRRRPVPHVSVYDLVGLEQARLIYVLSQRAPEPFAKTMTGLRRICRVVELMHLAGNRPNIKA